MNSILGIPSGSHDYINNLGANVYIIAILIFVIIVYYLFFNNLSTSIDGTRPMYGKMLEIGLWSVFLILILINGMQYFFNVNFTADISSMFSDTPQLSVKMKDSPSFDGPRVGDFLADGSLDASLLNRVGTNIADTNISNTPKHKRTRSADSKSSGTVEGGSGDGRKVFHLSDNRYTYDDAKAVCAAFDSRLATYNEVEDAYNRNADWCSYGWSSDSMILYPTQMKRWKRLQTIEGHENDCGRPGVNGGYIKNPNARFGVNCYGKRPSMSQSDQKRMDEYKANLYPKTEAEIAFEKDVELWRSKLSDLIVAPYNPSKWST